MPIETGRFAELFSGNYLLYGLVGNSFHRLLSFSGFSPIAVVSLQILDALIGAAGLFVFFQSLRCLGAERRTAAAWSAVLGLSLAYWKWSSDAENYIFSAFLLQVHWLALLAYAAGRRVPPVVLGAFHALTVLGHIVNMIFLPVGLWFLLAGNPRAWRRPAAQYLAASLAGVAVSYALVLGLAVRPHDAGSALLWLMGTLRTHGGGVGWHGGYSFSNFAQWLGMTLNIFASAKRRILWLAPAALAVLALTQIRGLVGQRKTAAIGCLIWLAAYAAVFASWEPYTMVYRISDLVPLITLIFLGVGRRASVPVALLLALLLGAGNFSAEIYPRSLPRNNPRLMRMKFFRTETPPNAWIASGEADAGNDELYIPFFARRRPIVLASYRGRLDDLSRRLDGLLAGGQPVFIHSRISADAFWRDWFQPYKPRLRARHSDGLELYELTRRDPR